jgi:tellurite resistance protein TehA-like permease
MPSWVSDTLIWTGTALWGFLFAACLAKWLLRRADAKAELEHPVQSCFIGLAGVVSLLASMGLATEHRVLSLGLFAFGTAWTLAFALYQTGRLWMGNRMPETNTPVAYLGVGSGEPDIFAHALIGYALLQALLFVRLIPWLFKSDLTPAWWSFSFGAASLPAAAMKLVAHGDAGAIATLAPYLFVAGNLVIAAIAAVTIRWAIQKARQPPPVLQPAD